MSDADFGNQWRNIDGPGDSGYFIRFMDVINSIPWFPSHKRRCIEFMQIKPGDHVLEVGCGTGEEARVMGQLVGPSGQVDAVDVSQTMVDEARRRSEGTGLPIQCRVSDGHALDFADNTFDAVGCFNTFEIIADPEKALAELVRVTRPGGRIVVPGPDTGTTVINSPDRELTRRMLNYFADKVVNGWIGRNMPGMFRAAGLVDVQVNPNTFTHEDFGLIRRLWLQSMADNSRDAGIITAEEATNWLAGLEQVSQTSGFFYGGTSFIVSGRKPS